MKSVLERRQGSSGRRPQGALRTKCSLGVAAWEPPPKARSTVQASCSRPEEGTKGQYSNFAEVLAKAQKTVSLGSWDRIL